MVAESPYNQDLKKAIRRLGIFAYKASDRFQGGIPDIYMARGNWIEGKAIPMPKRNNVSILVHVDPAQKILLNQLTHFGDQCFLAVYWVDERGIRYFTFIPWMDARSITTWGYKTIGQLSIPMDRTKLWKMDRFFHPKAPRRWLGSEPGTWWGDRLNEWKRDNPDYWRPPDTGRDVGIQLDGGVGEDHSHSPSAEGDG